jgi:hypothetical protein
MFDKEFYPSPDKLIELMMQGQQVAGKVFYEPQAGKGDIVTWLQLNEAKEVIASEIHPELQSILKTKCRIIADDFFTVTSDQISHIDHIVMNPPFSDADKHILHAFEIAPKGCLITAVCNVATLENQHTSTRKQLNEIIKDYGSWDDIGPAFEQGERQTLVSTALIKMKKPGTNYSEEFSGFFMEDDAPEPEGIGLMSYNVVRDLVHRYIETIKIYDQQLSIVSRMQYIMGSYFKQDNNDNSGGWQGNYDGKVAGWNATPMSRDQFKKQLQKGGWNFIFEAMDLKKYATKGLKEDINKFVEQQQDIPFTMRNIYHMLDMVVQTTGQRMDRAIKEVFEHLTKHHDDNRYNVPGWKTNLEYLVGKKFILPSYKSSDLVEDMVKALCYVTGTNYDHLISFDDYIRYTYFIVDSKGNFVNDPNYTWSVKYKYSSHEYQKDWEKSKIDKILKENPTWKLQKGSSSYGELFEWTFFKVRRYKKGTIHFEFKDEEVWAKFNKEVARILGYPPFLGRPQTKYQKRQSGVKEPKKKPVVFQNQTILFEAKVA